MGKEHRLLQCVLVALLVIMGLAISPAGAGEPRLPAAAQFPGGLDQESYTPPLYYEADIPLQDNSSLVKVHTFPNDLKNECYCPSAYYDVGAVISAGGTHVSYLEREYAY